MDIAAMASNISTAYTLAKGMIDIRDSQKLATVQIDLTERLLKAQAHITELLGMLTEKTMLAADLQESIRILERDQLERLRYELAEISLGGALAYRLKPASALMERPSEPPHFVCQSCLDVRGHKVILTMNTVWGSETFTCPECENVLTGRHVGS